MGTQSYPWFKFAHVEYLLDPMMNAMSLAAQGANTRLMAYAARQLPFGTLPNDEKTLFAMSGANSLKQWKKLHAELIGSTWFVNDDNRLFCPLMNVESVPVAKKEQKKEKKVLEKDIENYFYRNLTSYLPDACQITMTFKIGHIPDGFVSLPSLERPAPVEVKLNLFNRKAERQLRRYMQQYNSPVGVAVAPKFYDQSANDIIYVQIKKDEVSNGY